MELGDLIHPTYGWFGWKYWCAWSCQSCAGFIFLASLLLGNTLVRKRFSTNAKTISSFLFYFWICRCRCLSYALLLWPRYSDVLGTTSPIPSPDHHQPNRNTPSRPSKSQSNKVRRGFPHYSNQHLGVLHMDTCSSANFGPLGAHKQYLGPLWEGDISHCRRRLELLLHRHCPEETRGTWAQEVWSSSKVQQIYHRFVFEYGCLDYQHDESQE